MAEENTLEFRLYRRHDLDLIRIYKSKNVSFQKLVRMILQMYKDGQYAPVKLPFLEPSDDYKTDKNEYFVLMRFSDADYADIVGPVIKDIKDQYVTEFVKNLIRSYIFCGYNCIYYKDDIQKNISEKINNFTAEPLEYDTVRERIAKNQAEMVREIKRKKRAKKEESANEPEEQTKPKKDKKKPEPIMKEPTKEDLLPQEEVIHDSENVEISSDDMIESLDIESEDIMDSDNILGDDEAGVYADLLANL